MNIPNIIKTIVAIWIVCPVQAQTIVAPGSLAAVEGEANNGLPFNIEAFSLTSTRYQQVYEAALFSSLPIGGVIITAISFRIDGGSSSFNTTLPDIQMNLSTTSAGEGSLNSTFANNVGANDTIVFARGAMPLSGTGGSGPNPFNVTITLTQPFTYIPANGNLLLDVRNFGGGSTVQFDATFVVGDGLARVFTYGTPIGSTSGSGDAGGLITRFTYQPVPEPTTAMLAGIAGCLLLIRRRRI